MNVVERAVMAAKHEEPDRVPVVLTVYGMVLKRYCRITEREYYESPKQQMESKIAFIHRFPEVLSIFRGASPEYAYFEPATAFGGMLKWFKDAPPFLSEYPIKSPEDVDRLAENGVPDPREVGTSAKLLGYLRYFQEWFPKNIRDQYKPFYLDGYIHGGAPVEDAALCMGYDKFLIWMRLHPDVLHKLLRLVSEFIIKYCEAQEEIVGPARFLEIDDHSPSFVGKEQFREFVLPYLNKIFRRYKGALRMWHNEGSVSHMLEEVDKIDAEIWQFGYEDDPALCKSKTHFCLMGNIHPPLFAKYTPKQVEEECRKIIMKAGHGGGLWLSTGGGIAPGTPLENIDSMIRATEKYGVYPLRDNL